MYVGDAIKVNIGLYNKFWNKIYIVNLLMILYLDFYVFCKLRRNRW